MVENLGSGFCSLWCWGPAGALGLSEFLLNIGSALGSLGLVFLCYLRRLIAASLPGHGL